MMPMKPYLQCLFTALILFAVATDVVLAQGTAFMYHGRLNDNGIPASGSYDLTFAVFDADTGTNRVGGALTNSVVAVNNGLFTVTLDFGTGVFDGRDRWLEMGVRPSGAGDFTRLSPRQLLTPTPYAITAGHLAGTLDANQLTGTVSSALLGGGQFTRTFIFDSPSNSFAGSGAGLSEVNAEELGGLGAGSFWQLGGNAGTTPGVDFLGTTDNQPLELKVNGQRAFRLEPTTNSPNIIGGFRGNYAGSNIFGVTIGGGGDTNRLNLLDVYAYSSSQSEPPVLFFPNFGTIGGGAGNQIVSGGYGTIAGGATNSIIGQSRYYGGGANNSVGGGANNHISWALASIIAGGESNSISGGTRMGVGYSTIGGGTRNTIAGWYDPTDSATIAGGADNQIFYGSYGSAIGGGRGNFVGPWLGDATIAGGSSNVVLASWAAIGGGSQNTVVFPGGAIGGGNANRTVAPYATIGGGQGNRAWGNYGTVPGGIQAAARSYGQLAYASGQFEGPGDAQTSVQRHR